MNPIPEHLKFLADMYSAFVSEQTGRIFRFLGRKENEKKLAQLKKLNDIINELKIAPQIFLRVQFDKMLEYAKGKGMSYVPLGMIISTGAVKRFKEYMITLDEVYPKDSQKIEALLNTYDPVRKLICDSADAFAIWLDGITYELDNDNAVIQLEIVARLGLVSGMYLYSSPLVNGNSSIPSYIMSQIEVMFPTQRQKESIEDARKQVSEKYKGKIWGKYV